LAENQKPCGAEFFNQQSKINNIFLCAFVVKNGEKRKAPQKGRLNAE
jgi:hypothetical protein